jgi:hypothetical protein
MPNLIIQEYSGRGANLIIYFHLGQRLRIFEGIIPFLVSLGAA